MKSAPSASPSAAFFKTSLQTIISNSKLSSNLVFYLSSQLADMKNYTSLLLIFLGVALPFLTFSQDLKIVYNAETGSMRYFKNEKEINKPIIKKGGLIVLKIENYNNYLYDIDFEKTVEKVNIPQGSGALGGVESFGLANLLPPGFAPPTTLSSNSVDQGDFFDNTPEPDFGPGNGFGTSDQQRKVSALKKRAAAKITILEDIEAEFAQQKIAVEKIEDQRALKGVALEEVEKIKLHPKIPPSKIKTYSKSFFEKVFDVSDISQLSLSEVLDRKSDAKRLDRIFTEVQKEKQQYEGNIDDLTDIARQLESLNGMTGSASAIQNKILNAPGIAGNMTALGLNIETLKSEATDDNIQDLMSIWYEYEAISSNEFSTAFRATGAGDLTNLAVKLILKDSMRKTGAPALISLAPISVPVYGGIKINASIGANFGQYFERPQTYFLRDSTLVGQDGDSFLPFITSFVHFYPQGRKSVSVGGSLGVGIPLSGSAGLQSATFFLGPSFFFGNGERLVVNLGLMGGKVNRLSEGYKVGDRFVGDEDFIPIQSLYELGFFAGLSFNIRG